MMDEIELDRQIEETRRVLDKLIFDGSLGSVIAITATRTTLRTLLLVKGLSFDEVTEYMRDRFNMFDYLDSYELVSKEILEW